MNKHPVSELQEKMAKQQKPLPTYTIQNASVTTGYKFVCMVQFEGITVVGFGSNKQNAKFEAAKKALEKLENPSADSRGTTPEFQTFIETSSSSIIDGNYIGELNELALQYKLSMPTYSEFGMNKKNEFIIRCILLENCTKGFASTKKQAKQNAAKEMLTILKSYLSRLNVNSIDSLKEKMSDLIDLVPLRTFASDEEVVEKFQKLAIENKPRTQQEPLDLLTSHSPPPTPSLPTASRLSNTDLWNQLNEIVNIYNLQVIQKNPKCILVLNLGHNGEKSVMEVGETYDETYSKLLNKAIIIAKTL